VQQCQLLGCKCRVARSTPRREGAEQEVERRRGQPGFICAALGCGGDAAQTSGGRQNCTLEAPGPKHKWSLGARWSLCRPRGDASLLLPAVGGGWQPCVPRVLPPVSASVVTDHLVSARPPFVSSFSYKDMEHTGLGPTLMTPSLLVQESEIRASHLLGTCSALEPHPSLFLLRFLFHVHLQPYLK
jgi:hypothetical protein